MDILHQRIFKKNYKKAKEMVNHYKRDFVIIYVPGEIPSCSFQVCLAERFFEKGMKRENLVCYLSHP